ncbi:MAG: hypothetical protein KAI24_07055 [Planctomycetes bacterium]|nr:hypothetical protein [Planctomycetota bacterium]
MNFLSPLVTVTGMVSHKFASLLLSLFLAAAASAQGTADISCSGRDANGTRVLKVDMSGVTGGTVTVYFGPNNSYTLQPGTGVHEFSWPDETSVIITSSNGKKVSGYNKAPTASDETVLSADDSGYNADAVGPDLTIS